MNDELKQELDQERASDVSGQQSSNAIERRGPLNRARIREKMNALHESSVEKDFKDTDGEFINRQSSHEPLSLAERITRELSRGEKLGEQIVDVSQELTDLGQLQKMTMPELLQEADKAGIEDVTGFKRQELIFLILKSMVKTSGLMFGAGTLEILPDGFGFLRSPDYHYLSCPDDIYVSPSQIRRFTM